MRSIKSLAKRVLGQKRSRALRYAARQGRYAVLRLLNKFPFLGRIYVLLFTSAYDREIRGVLAGQVAHIKNKQGREPVNYHLRRSIHRLEKGLSMQPLRTIFGVDIIGATVASYEKTYRLTSFCNSTDLRWAHDVLSAYFRVCESHPLIDEARSRFEGIGRGAKADELPSLIPFERSESPQLSVTYEQLHQLALRRRSVRWYQPRQVERAMIDQAVVLAGLSPSACNRQPFEFRIIDKPSLLEQCRVLPMGIRGFAENIPVLIAVVGTLRAYSEPRDRHAIYVDGSLAAMSFMFAAETLGLATCPINWPDIASRERQAANVLGLTEDQRIILWMSLGYPDATGKVPYSAKIDLDALRKFN